jgi:hypothetical protein
MPHPLSLQLAEDRRHPVSPEMPSRRPIWLILLAVALLGVAHVAFLPPFEGYDENAHWSYIQQIADQSRLPPASESWLSGDFEDYDGPRPFEMSTPDKPSGAAFRRYFAGPHGDLGRPVARAYRSGAHPNWEPRQQPPLYYVLLAPAYRLARNLSWPDHFLVLRLVSWAMAFAGFALGALATLRWLRREGATWAVLWLIPAWPILFPELFPEMARLGNDSLALLFAGIAWYFILALLEQPSLGRAVGLGLALGLGLWTKSFFLPISAGVALLFLYAAWRRGEGRHLGDILLALLLAGAIGGSWYLGNYRTYGSVFGQTEFAALRQAGGLLPALMALPKLDLALQLARGVALMAATFAWAGTWTLAHPPNFLLLPVVALALIPAGLWIARFARWPVAGQAPLFLAAPLVAGLLSHQLLSIATGGAIADTPGWYLHILCGPLSLALALGWRWPRALSLLAAYAVLFHALSWASQLSLFSGCAYKPGARMALTLDAGSCLIAPSHLAEIGTPALGFASLALAALAGLGALFLIRRESRPGKAGA